MTSGISPGILESVEDTETLITAEAIQGLLNLNNQSEEEDESFQTSMQWTKIDRNMTIRTESSISEIKSFFDLNYNLIKVLETFDETQTQIVEKPLILAFHNLKRLHKELRPWFDIIQELAIFQDNITFAVADFTSFSIKTYLHECEYKDISEKMRPTIYAIDKQNNQYEFEGFLNAETLREYANKLLNGKLFKSEPLPDAAAFRTNQVTVAVGYNLKDLILKTDKDIFITFYVPWCRFSQELLPHLDEIANLLQHDDVVIVKMNAELNHVPLKYNVFCYPRSYYISKDNKHDIILYDFGPRTIENLLKFVAKNSTKELKFYDRTGVQKKV